jgi:hypothetical protein
VPSTYPFKARKKRGIEMIKGRWKIDRSKAVKNLDYKI